MQKEIIELVKKCEINQVKYGCSLIFDNKGNVIRRVKNTERRIDKMAMPKIIKILEEKENESGWILASERLPKNEEKVLYVTKDGTVQSGIYYDDNVSNFEWYELAVAEGLFDNDSSVVGWKPYNQKKESR
jgi:hypothetical protein